MSNVLQHPSMMLATFSARLGTFAMRLVLCAGVLGCRGASYDQSLAYPVRGDWLVANGTWDIAPTALQRPGRLPLDELKLPEKDQSSDAANLRKLIGKKLFDPNKIPEATRVEYARHLGDMFGTPAKPTVNGFEATALRAMHPDLSAESIAQSLDLHPEKLAQGSKLFRQHCLHCHGLEGHGRGPTGPWVNPPPRDFRQGLFKFTSSKIEQNQRKPRREDLLRTLQTGIEGTAMPSFGLLSRPDLDALISYVIHLSLRGETEYLTMLEQLRSMEDGRSADSYVAPLREDLTKPTLRQSLEDHLALSAGRWVAAQKPDAVIIPWASPYPSAENELLKSAARGAKIFSVSGLCISCHQNYGRESNLAYDSWGTIVRGRNLYEGIFRGGRRPVDLFYRIHGGIVGSGMAEFKDLKSKLNPADVGVTPEEFEKIDPVWDVINFVRCLPLREFRDRLRSEYQIPLPE